MTSLLSDAEKAAARKLYLSDPALSVDAVAASYGVTRQVMLRVLRGITRPSGGRQIATKLTTKQMIDMRNKGITLFEIGKQAGLTESGVYRRIQRELAKR
jgi:hypothetical protein